MARKRLTIRQKLRKTFDKALNNSSAMQFIVLIVLTLIILGAGTGLALLLLPPEAEETAVAAEEARPGVKDAAWWTWNRVTNPGMLPDDSDKGVWVITLSSIVILCGWIVFGLLISILTTAFQERLEQIRRGGTEVLAVDHTILLGWNSTIFSVIDQFGSSDEDLSGEVVVLADLEVDSMREEAGKYCTPAALRNVDFRRGSIASIKNIRNLKIEDARQVIILGFETEGEAGSEGEGAADATMHDSSVLKALLACFQAVSGDKGARTERLPIVASVMSGESARIMERGVPGSVAERIQLHVVHAADLLSRLSAQSANQPGLALVYKELFSYQESLVDGVDIGSEIYIVDVDKKMHGLTLDECLLGYDRAIPIGYANDEAGPVVNPMPGTPAAARRFAKGDRIIAVADNKEDVVWTGKRDLPAQDFTGRDAKPEAKTVLVLGDGLKPRKITEYLPGFLPEGSRIFTSQSSEGLDPGACSFHEFTHPTAVSADGGGDSSVSDSDLRTYDSIVLSDETSDPDRHDAKVLMDLTAIYASAAGEKIKASVIVELLDSRNLTLAAAFGEMAAIVSSELVSNFLVQLAVDPERGNVFRELLDPAGNEFYIRPVARFVGGDEKLSFTDIMARAKKLKEVAIGYVPPGGEPLQLCPRDRTTARPPAEFGEIVVIAED
jgi:hypothetical protein